MRRALVTTLLAVVALPVAAAAGAGPGAMVLHASDVPKGFVVDRAETGPRPNEREWRGEPELRRVLQRAGRVTGYEARFERGADSIASRVDLLRAPVGGRLLLDYFDREMLKAGISRLHRSRARIGDQGWLYGDQAGNVLTIVAWRSGRVFAAVVGAGVPRARVVGLARVQQRRVVAALR